MREILLTRGQVAITDDVDFETLSLWKWYLSPEGYACRTGRKSEGVYKQRFYLHRQVMGVTDSLIEVDHVNGNRLDNRRCNLRLCSKIENRRNKLLQVNSTSGYKGVSFRNATGKWQAKLKNLNKWICLGDFDTKEQAAIAYNEAALTHFGEFAHLNEVR